MILTALARPDVLLAAPAVLGVAIVGNSRCLPGRAAVEEDRLRAIDHATWAGRVPADVGRDADTDGRPSTTS